jgi:hypothetical protein
VKEIWETKKPLDAIIHTMGWPLPSTAFGGSFAYPLEPNVIALGLVVGLDYRDARLDVHALLQRMKTHPLFREYLDGGEMVEWGAKTIPEGGYYAIPSRRSGNGVVVLGDSAGFVEVASLKGVHYAVQSGILAARAIFDALKKGDVSAASLAAYDDAVDSSFIRSDLHARRNMRLAFKSGFYIGGARSLLMTATGGRFPGGRIESETDAAEPRTLTGGVPFTPDGDLTFSKLDAVFKAGNATRDDIPSHSSSARMCRRNSRTSTRPCARQASTNAMATASSSMRPTAWTARRRTCWGRAGRRERVAPARATGGCDDVRLVVRPAHAGDARGRHPARDTHRAPRGTGRDRTDDGDRRTARGEGR